MSESSPRPKQGRIVKEYGDINAVTYYRQTLVRLAMAKPVTATHRACLFLARHGRRFLVDFGVSNARDMAQHLRRELRDKAAKKARRR